MKKMKMLICFMLLFSVRSLYAQPSTAAVQLATHIAQKMKDTIGLTSQQYTQVYNINIDLHNQKMAARQTSTSDSLSIYLQKIEHKRDSLYQLIMTDAKFQLYLNKKNHIVTSN